MGKRQFIANLAHTRILYFILITDLLTDRPLLSVKDKNHLSEVSFFFHVLRPYSSMKTYLTVLHWEALSIFFIVSIYPYAISICVNF